MTRRLLFVFAVAFTMALAALWLVHRHSVERSLGLVQVTELKRTLTEARQLEGGALTSCASDQVCEGRVRAHERDLEQRLVALEELDLLREEIAVSLALYAAGPFVLLFVLAYAGLFLVGRRLLVPLRDVSEAASAYADGDETRFPIAERGSSEVRALATALNRMLATIRRQSEALTTHARSLGWREIAREVVHETRNLMTPLKLGAEAVVERAVTNGDDALLREGQKLTAGLAALERMTAALKDLSSRRFPDLGAVDLSELLPAVAETYGSAAIAVDVDVVGDCRAVGDADLLAEALGNMIDNARDAGARRVVLAARLDGARCVTECRDDGPGIAADIRSRATMLGFSTKPHGSGFGLYFAGKLATELGGQLDIESPEGRGAVVRLVLQHAYDPDRRR